MIDLAALERDLRAARGGRPPPAGMLDVVVDTLDLPGGAVHLARPADWDLLCERGGDSPFWAIVWPSGEALARRVAAAPERFAGRRVIELGCGLGLPSVLAARAGAAVLATDRSPAAVVFARLNLALNGCTGDARVLDVLDPPPVSATHDVVLAADVVYDRRAVAPLLDLVPRLLDGAGELWLTDPARDGLDELLAGARERWPPAIEIRVETVARVSAA